jgi:hypothetical protein
MNVYIISCPKALLRCSGAYVRRFSTHTLVGATVKLFHMLEVGWASASAIMESAMSSVEKSTRHLAQSTVWMSLTSNRVLGAKLRCGSRPLQTDIILSCKRGCNLNAISHNTTWTSICKQIETLALTKVPAYYLCPFESFSVLMSSFYLQDMPIGLQGIFPVKIGEYAYIIGGGTTAGNSQSTSHYRFKL